MRCLTEKTVASRLRVAKPVWNDLRGLAWALCLTLTWQLRYGFEWAFVPIPPEPNDSEFFFFIFKPEWDDDSLTETWEPLSRSEEHTSELQSRFDLVCRLLLEKKNNNDKLAILIQHKL